MPARYASCLLPAAVGLQKDQSSSEDAMATANDRLHAIDPRRRVDRSLYPKDADMPEFPGAVLLNHVGLRTAQAGALAGMCVISPLLWMRSGFKTPLFSQIVPKLAGRYGCIWHHPLLLRT